MGARQRVLIIPGSTLTCTVRTSAAIGNSDERVMAVLIPCLWGGNIILE